MRHTVPHSPADLAAPAHIKPCHKMERLLQQFAAEFGLRREVIGPELPAVQALPAPLTQQAQDQAMPAQ